MKHQAEIHACIEVMPAAPSFWAPLPPAPWPSFVRLSHATPSSNVALAVATLSSYGHYDGPATSAAALLADFPPVAPSGLSVASHGRAVMPSCCYGLESWTEWLAVTTTESSPWMGHSP